MDSKIRTFPSGSTRDTVAGKLSYMKALSPEVLEAYVTYLDKHRKLPDGSMREFDNWKLGIDKWVYLDGLLRHDKAVWNLMLGYKVSDNHGPVTLLDSLMAVIFNATGLAYELLIEEGKAKRQEERKVPITEDKSCMRCIHLRDDFVCPWGQGGLEQSFANQCEYYILQKRKK